jgi:hypothetical protein
MPPGAAASLLYAGLLIRWNAGDGTLSDAAGYPSQTSGEEAVFRLCTIRPSDPNPQVVVRSGC